MNAVHRLIGMGSDSMLASLIGRHDDAIADAGRSEYELLMPEVRPFPSAAALLGDLHHSHVEVALTTSAPADHVARLIDLLGIDQTIHFATHSDSKWEVEAANAARLRCIAVESGGFSENELLNAGAVAVYRDVHDLRTCLSTSPLAELHPSAGS